MSLGHVSIGRNEQTITQSFLSLPHAAPYADDVDTVNVSSMLSEDMVQ